MLNKRVRIIWVAAILAVLLSTILLPATALAAPATSQPASAALAAGFWYRVRVGDTLSGIAARYGTTVGAIVSANHISNRDFIYAGRSLWIPRGGGGGGTHGFWYRVRAGDTLAAIAWRYGVSVSALARANGISNRNLIYVGRRLWIP